MVWLIMSGGVRQHADDECAKKNVGSRLAKFLGCREARPDREYGCDRGFEREAEHQHEHHHEAYIFRDVMSACTRRCRA